MIRVAIVEDNKTTREGMKKIIDLSSVYHCICTCSTAEDALRDLPEHQPEFVLMDIELPGMSGIECVKLLKNKIPFAQIIMVTVYEDPDRIFRALRAGASGYLLKRSAPDEILSELDNLRQGGAPMSPEIARKVVACFQTEGASNADVEKLTSRERQVLELIVQGFSNKEIASQLNIALDTIRGHLKTIYSKLQVHSRTEAVLKYHRPHP